MNPALGEAWIERARLTPDPVKAEELYRKGLELAPNYGAGYAHYANFLFRESRAGEAIETITRASQIDPLTPELYQIHAFFLMVTRSDVAGHDRLMREALAINPRLPSALRQLAQSRWEYSGEFADAAQLIERAIAVDPQWAPSRTLARDIYLDLGDRAAAVAVLGDSLPPDARMEIAQYDGDRKRAAALLADVHLESSRDTSGSHGANGGSDSRRRSRYGRVRPCREAPRVRVCRPGEIASDVEPRVLAGIRAHAGACG